MEKNNLPTSKKKIKKSTQEDWEVWVDLYVNKKLSPQKISDLTGFSRTTIFARLRKKGVLRPVSESNKVYSLYTPEARAFWVHQYTVEKKSLKEIVQENKASEWTIRHHLQTLGVIRIQSKNKKLKKKVKIQFKSCTLCTDTDVNLWVKLYVTEKLSARQVAKKTGVSHEIILKRLGLLGVLRTRSKSRKRYTNDDYDLWLKLYVEKKLSSYKIAKITKASPSAIQVALRKFGVLRSISEIQTIYTEKDFSLWEDLYRNKNRSTMQIAEETSASPATIKNKLRELNVLRSRSETWSFICKYSLKTHALWTTLHKEQKKSFAEIAVETSVSVKIVTRFFQNSGDLRPYSYASSWQGFYLNRAEDLDTLYFIKVEWQGKYFAKIGRSFDLKSRFPAQSTWDTPASVQVYGTWLGKHVSIFELEQKIRVVFSQYSISLSYKFKGSTECFFLNLPRDKVISFIKKEMLRNVD